MTFKETEFPSLVKFLKTFVNEETDPFLVKDVVMQLIKLYEDVPLYPGIVRMCLGGVIKTADPKNLVVGQKVFVKNREDCYVGTVASKDSECVTLKSVKSVTYEDELELDYKDMDKVSVVNEKVLEEMWPSLVFEKEKRK